jgi:hypothetical protein
VIAIKKLLKKDLTDGDEAPGGRAAPPDAEGAAGRNLTEPQIERLPPRPVNVGKPLSSLSAALPFARRLLIWLDNVGINGEIDWPKLVTLSHEFAEFSGLRPISERALARALSQLGVPKTVRNISAHEKGIVSLRKSKAKRPRVRVYILGKDSDPCSSTAEPRLDLFDE